MLKRVFLILLILAASHYFALADPLLETSRTRIDYGHGDGQIGLVESAGEHWKPLFFAVDNDGNIHIPDFYKARIAVFDKTGKLKEAKPCPQGLSPRLNYFGQSPHGWYVTFGDGSLFVIKPDGKLAYSYNFGYGIIPARIVPARSAIFVILPPHLDKDGRAILFDYGSSRPLGRYGMEKRDGNIPLIHWADEQEYTPLLKDMAVVRGTTGRFQGPVKASFIGADEEGRSLWSEKTDTGETILIYSKDGILLDKGYVAFPSGLPGTGFWTVADDALTVYKNFFFKDHMLVVGYRFGKKE